jgi:hypothetical protein
MVYSFTSKAAFKSVTFKIKESLTKNVKVSDIRKAAASCDGFNSINDYMDALDKSDSLSNDDEWLK